VAVGDFNNDGKPDIAVIDNPYISILLGNGDGTFQSPSDNDSFPIPQWLAVGDFNNDLRLDVITTGSVGSSYNVGVLLGNGNGTLQNSITTPVDYVPGTVAVGDFNSDGNLDAVLGYDLAGVAVLLGNGDGSFQPAVNYNTTGLGGGYVVVSDLGLNGKLDLVVPSGPPAVDVFWGNGDGTFQPAQGFAAPEGGVPAVGDLNGDGLPDLAMASTLYGMATMLNTGVVSFSPTTAPLEFALQAVNTTSPRQTLTLTNAGTTDLSITSIKASGPFHLSDKCGSSVPAGSGCNVSVQYAPTKTGAQAGLITLIDGASSRPQFVELSGSATAVELSPTALAFGDQKVGTRSAPRTVTATNTSTAAVTFTEVVVGGKNKVEFSASGNCAGQTIEPGHSCKMSVTFDPTQTGAASAALYFDLPTGAISPTPVTLAGSGD
jgi:hypothetical protein